MQALVASNQTAAAGAPCSDRPRAQPEGAWGAAPPGRGPARGPARPGAGARHRRPLRAAPQASGAESRAAAAAQLADDVLSQLLNVHRARRARARNLSAEGARMSGAHARVGGSQTRAREQRAEPAAHADAALEGRARGTRGSPARARAPRPPTCDTSAPKAPSPGPLIRAPQRRNRALYNRKHYITELGAHLRHERAQLLRVEAGERGRGGRRRRAAAVGVQEGVVQELLWGRGVWVRSQFGRGATSTRCRVRGF